MEINQLTAAEATKIGSRQGLLSVGIGLLLAQLLLTFFLLFDKGLINAFLWFSKIEYELNIFMGVVIMLLCGHFFGQIAGKQILIRKRNFVLVGAATGLAILVTTTFLSSWTGIFQEGWRSIGTNDNPFEDYILKPLYWVVPSGFIPALIIGIWSGWRIKKRNAKAEYLTSGLAQNGVAASGTDSTACLQL